jgi:phytoene dehydrogenase-like protein
VSGGWANESLRKHYLDRVLARLEQFAPGTTASVLGSHIIAPTDLLAANPNAIQGDPYAGSAELDQNLRWRPYPGAVNHQTPVKGVWHIGAATHPGPGLGAGSGHLVAQRIISGKVR